MNELLSHANEWLEALRLWLAHNELGFMRELPLALRAVLMWIVGAMAASLVVGLMMVVGATLSSLTMVLARFTAIRVGGANLAKLAKLVVSIESVMGRIGVLMREPSLRGGETLIEVIEVLKNSEPDDIEHHYWGPRHFSRAVTLPLVVAGFVFRLLVGLIHLASGTVKTLIRAALQPSGPSIAGWLVTLWYFQWFDNLLSWLSTWRLPSISVTHVVAALTILVLLYIAFGADIRGRAEINKHASFEVRKQLLSTRVGLATAADAIRNLRNHTQPHLDDFPNSPRLVDFTGNKQLLWRLSTVIHPARWHTNRHLPNLIIEEIDFRSSFNSVDEDDIEKYQDRRRDAAANYEQIHDRQANLISESDDILQIAFKELIKAGVDDKIVKVLPGPFAYMWHDLVDSRIELDNVIALSLAGSTKWLTTYADTQHLQLVTDAWNAINKHDKNYLSETVVTARQTGMILRNAVKNAYIDQWWLAVTEHRCRAVERKIGEMITPSFLSRLHQAIGK